MQVRQAYFAANMHGHKNFVRPCSMPWYSRRPRQTWCNCCSTKLVHCWIIFPRSAWHFRSLITRPRANASRRVRKVRRKLLAWQFSPLHWSNILNKKFSSQERQNSRKHMWFLNEQRTGSRKYKTYNKKSSNKTHSHNHILTCNMELQ